MSSLYYIEHPFKSELEFNIARIKGDLSEVLSLAIKPEESL